MTQTPARCVVDTNVATTANGSNPAAGVDCMAASASALQSVMNAGHVFLDDGGKIVDEYRDHLRPGGQPGPGDVFLKWVLTHEWGGQRVTRVALTPTDDDPEDFVELPPPPAGITYDRSDRKFLAVSAAHPEHPAILQSCDSKWWGWRDALAAVGVSVHFLCEVEIAAKHRQKMGQ